MSQILTEHLQSEIVVLMGKRSENHMIIQVTNKDQGSTQLKMYNLNLLIASVHFINKVRINHQSSFYIDVAYAENGTRSYSYIEQKVQHSLFIGNFR